MLGVASRRAIVRARATFRLHGACALLVLHRPFRQKIASLFVENVS